MIFLNNVKSPFFVSSSCCFGIIASKGYKTVTPVIVTNPDEYSAVKRVADGNVTEKDVLIELAKE